MAVGLLGMQCSWGGPNENVFVDGATNHSGLGANIFAYLSPADSPYTDQDMISNFDPAKDVIDLSAIDADPATPGTQNFTFIGDAPFDGKGAEVRTQYVPALNTTLVEVNLAGDDFIKPDMEIRFSGYLTAANFALTPEQSAEALANGAALTETRVTKNGQYPIEYAYSNVKGRDYSSYQAFYSSVGLMAEDWNVSSSGDEFTLYQNGVTVTRGSGAETLGTEGVSLTYRPTETIDIPGEGARRSRNLSVEMLPRSVRHFLPSRTGVLPVFTTCCGPCLRHG